MYNTDRKSTLQQYHYQAGKDWDATIVTASAIIETTMDAILESYNEFLADLMVEQLEAY